ncbi:MAG: glutamine-hydrolyzing carbamoyl-phosphate synthase small subunit [Bacteroidales bacterium]|nr:glutamine-hydrolyzing carbamoyl-phosphate synthase small subunit [Bacteroidales bacterium]
MTIKARIILEDGTVFEGKSFGYEKSVAGEVVFNTAMMGYPESLTDPSYAGQILVMTYPLVGNYGVPERVSLPNGLSRFMESEQIHVEALVVFDYSKDYSHWNAKDSLAAWLAAEKIPGVYDVDTRALTKLLREKGSMKGKIIIGDDAESIVDFVDPNLINLVDRVSCKEVIRYDLGPDTKKVVLIDCGVKHNIIRNLLSRNISVIRVPWDYDFKELDYDGLFISNGPGDPAMCKETIAHIKDAFNDNKPICGICMGNQLLGAAAGASIYKLKYGHRSHNQPVREEGTNICHITSQNHGYALDTKGLGKDWAPLYTNLNDGTNEGIYHKTKPFFSSQFHPEAASGPTDTVTVFDKFKALL